MILDPLETVVPLIPAAVTIARLLHWHRPSLSVHWGFTFDDRVCLPNSDVGDDIGEVIVVLASIGLATPNYSAVWALVLVFPAAVVAFKPALLTQGFNFVPRRHGGRQSSAADRF